MNTVEIIEADHSMPLGLMQSAIAKGASVEVMRQLLDLHERSQAFEARKAFDAAMAAAKAEIPVIVKSNTVDFTTKFGRTHYAYEDIGSIAEVIDPILSKHGLYYRWSTEPTDNPAVTLVTCIVSHRDGHSIQNSLPAIRDETGNKNINQAVGSAVTYMQRYTLKAALGIAAAKDDDGRGGAETQSEYLMRWTALIRDATDDVELKTQWQDEADLRRQVFSAKDNDAVKRLVDKVIARCKELQSAQEQHEASLPTQRLKAEDA
jgi:hypothetical protein